MVGVFPVSGVCVLEDSMEGRIGGSDVHEIEIIGEKCREEWKKLLFEEGKTTILAKVIIHNKEQYGVGRVLELLQKRVIAVLAKKGTFPSQEKGNASHGCRLLPF